MPAFIVQQGRLPAGGPASRFVPNGGVGGVKADDIYPQAGETGGQLVGGFMVRGVGAGGQVEPNKPGPCAVREIEVAVLYGDVAVLCPPGRPAGGRNPKLPRWGWLCQWRYAVSCVISFQRCFRVALAAALASFFACLSKYFWFSVSKSRPFRWQRAFRSAMRSASCWAARASAPAAPAPPAQSTPRPGPGRPASSGLKALVDPGHLLLHIHKGQQDQIDRGADEVKQVEGQHHELLHIGSRRHALGVHEAHF